MSGRAFFTKPWLAISICLFCFGCDAGPSRGPRDGGPPEGEADAQTETEVDPVQEPNGRDTERADPLTDNGTTPPSVQPSSGEGGRDAGMDAGTSEPCTDADGDGHGAVGCGGDDCDDADPEAHPGASEVCGNDRDDDCDPDTEDFFDADGDGRSCVYDCDDADPSLPTADGLCGNVVYRADFEQGPAGWVVEGGRTQGVVDRGVASWELGVPAGTFIDSAGQGERAWVTNLSGAYQNDEASYLVSPRLDFSSLSQDPVLRFEHIFDLAPDTDVTRVQWRLGEGAWQVLGEKNSGANWHAAYTPDGFDGRSDADGAWRTAIHRLDGTAGQSSVQLRFELVSDVAQVAEGVGVDDVQVLAALNDLAVVDAWTQPAVCANDADWLVHVTVTNVGNQPVAAAALVLSLAGESTHTEELVDIAVGETRELQLNVGRAPSPGTQALRVALSSTDGWPADDALDVSIQGLAVIEGAAYFEDFESGPAGWVHYAAETRTAERSTWEWGVPQGEAISHAASGTHAFVTGLASDPRSIERSYLQSPCFDLSDLAEDPWLMLSRAFDLEADGWGWVQAELTLDGGDYWLYLYGVEDTQDGWYSDVLGWWVGHSDADGNWRSGKQRLTDAAGETSVSVRLVHESDIGEGFGVDDVQIAREIRNLEIRTVELAQFGCEGRTGGSVLATVRNNGTQEVEGFELSLRVDGTPLATHAVTASLAPGEESSHSLPLEDALTSLGRHEVTVSLEVDDDRASDNVFTCPAFTQPRVDGVGYEEGFESGTGNWFAYGRGVSWQRGKPRGGVIVGAPTGKNAWVTNLLGNTPGDERSQLVSPCFDLSDATVDPLLRFSHVYHSYASESLAWWEVSTDGGQSFTRLGDLDTGVAWYDGTGDHFDYERWEYVLDDRGVWTDSEEPGGREEWHAAEHTITGAAGSDRTLLRFHFFSQPSLGLSETEGHGLDDVRIVSPGGG